MSSPRGTSEIASYRVQHAHGSGTWRATRSAARRTAAREPDTMRRLPAHASPHCGERWLDRLPARQDAVPSLRPIAAGRRARRCLGGNRWGDGRIARRLPRCRSSRAAVPRRQPAGGEVLRIYGGTRLHSRRHGPWWSSSRSRTRAHGRRSMSSAGPYPCAWSIPVRDRPTRPQPRCAPRRRTSS